MAYNLSQKMEGGLLRLKSFVFFLRVNFFCKSSLFITLQVLEKPKKMTFHRTTVKRTLQQNPWQVMPLFALSVEPKTKLFVQPSKVIFFCWTRVLSIIGVHLQVNWRKLTVSLSCLQAKPFKFTANFKLYRCWKNPRSWRFTEWLWKGCRIRTDGR